ncbi:MAG: alpha/beta hydrolase family protein [Desulfovibrionaceae bacterium]
MFACLHPSLAIAEGGIDPADPMVRVTSPPTDLDVDAVLVKVGRDVSAATGVGEEFITYYWQTFDSVIYNGHPSKDPLFVDLYVPGFFSDEQVESMMLAVADALEKHAGVDKKWLFIHTHFPLQGQIYIGGAIQHWDNYRGAKSSQPRPMSQRSMGGFLFNDPSFVFQSLWRAGVAATGGADLGEVLTATGRIDDFDHESWYDSWNSMARTVQGKADGFAAAGHELSAQEAYFRATNYFRASEIYLGHDDPRAMNAWRDGRETFLRAADLSDGRIEHVRIPYEDTTLPGYFLTPDNSQKKRPLLLIQTGLDGTAEDLYFIVGAQAVKRGYNCLIFEGPGQGEMMRVQDKPFRPDWEKVVTPVLDYALARPDVDPERAALLGYSMGGYLAPRAAAHDARIRWLIADGGVFSVYDGTLTKFPEEAREAMDSWSGEDEVDELVRAEMEKRPEVSQFINQMLLTFQADSPYALLKKLQEYTLEDSIKDLKCEVLVVNSSQDQVAGSNQQAKLFYNALKTTKTYMEFTDEQGGQFHCQLGAPMASSERILNWLDERAKP